jgi:DNA polymerase III subunit alpha
MTFVNTHSHSYYSLLDGFNSPDELVKRAVELEMPGIAITDHGVLTGHREFIRSCNEHGLKGILGVEAYFTPDRNVRIKDKDKLPDDKRYNHIVLLAQNDTGLRNISRMNEIAYEEGFYYKPRMDYETLANHSEGVIVVSGCMSGVISQHILKGEDEKAAEAAAWFKDVFGDNFYMEIQPHNSELLNTKSLYIADAQGIKSVVTLDCHYTSPEFRVAEEVMLAMTSKKKNPDYDHESSKMIADTIERLDYIYGDRSMSFKDLPLYLMSADEAQNALSAQGIERPELFSNTLEIADKVEGYDLPSNLDLLPIIVNDPQHELEQQARAGLAKMGLDTNPEYVDRLNEELEIIKAKNFAAYFLIVADVIQNAKANGVLVGPGRGSSAGSLVCFVMSITTVDPIENGLLFFRFIDIERDDWPDVDTDIQDNRRDESKQYLADKYGDVAGIATYNTFKDKAAIKDVARAFDVPFKVVNDALKGIDTFEQFMESPKTKMFRQQYPDVVKYAEMVRGRVRSTGVHAAGIVTSNRPINEIAPIEYRTDENTGKRVPIVALNMNEAADVGLIKIDLLGLKTLTVIDDTLKLIKKRHAKDIDLDKLPLNDPAIYEDLSAGRTKGVFQAEQPAYTGLLIKMGVRNFAELAASNALVRPGAMNSIGADYVSRKNGTMATSYHHAIMKPFTSETYGCILYQEQVMLTCTELAGMSMGDANKIRKIIGKKKDVHEFDQYKERFIEGASKHVPEKVAEKLWHDFEAHADYSFNKSHAYAYSLLTYWTAWLKHYYPTEFVISMLQSEDDKDVRMQYIIEARRLGIGVLLPHINHSKADYSIEGDSIRIGLSSVKWISENVAEKIIAARPYTDYASFKKVADAKFSGINARAVGSLNAVGGAHFPDNPKTGLEKDNYYEILGLPEFSSEIPDWVTAKFSEAIEFEEDGEFILHGLVKAIKRGPGWSRVEIVDKTGTVGVFDQEDSKVTAGSVYVFAVAQNSIVDFLKPEEVTAKRKVLSKYLMSAKALCRPDERVVIAARSRKTKKGDDMATVLLSDDAGELESALVFNYNYNDVMPKLTPGRKIKPLLSRTKDGALTIKDVM